MTDVDQKELADIFDVETADISIDKDEHSHSITEEALEKLYEADIVTSTSGTKVTLEAYVSGNTVCEIDYMIFDSVGYIHWTSVPEQHRNKGVATTVREGVIRDIISRGVSDIYSYPASETGLLLARKQGFSQTDDLSHGFGTWMKRSV